jgi:hypothetical protein
MCMEYFLGFGRANATFQFFGIEEGGHYDNTEDRNAVYQHAYQRAGNNGHYFTLTAQDFQEFYNNHPLELELDIDGASRSSLYSIERLIFNRLNGKTTAFCNFDLWNHDVLLSNWYSGPGLNQGERANYLFEHIMGLPQNNYVFCLGQAGERRNFFQERRVYFDEGHFQNQNHHGQSTFYQAQGRRIWLVNHPSYNNFTVNQAWELCNRILEQHH